jgi:hypothetical protein
MTNEYGPEDQFLEFYHAQVVNQGRRAARYPVPRYFTDPTDADVIKDSRDFYYQEYQDRMEMSMEYDRVLVVEIPSRSLATMSRKHLEFTSSVGVGGGKVALDILNQKWEEKRIRDTNPAVKLAWEQYSLMLHLASNGKSFD